jgi:hypothetical protein
MRKFFKADEPILPFSAFRAVGFCEKDMEVAREGHLQKISRRYYVFRESILNEYKEP